MKETVKSVLLALLVAVSLLQSYVLVYNMPIFESGEEVANDYIQTETMGREEAAENLVLPDRMILHFGDGRHTVFYADTPFFNMIFEGLQKREFSGFQKNTSRAFDWEEIRDEYEGIELRFAEGAPIELLTEILLLKGEVTLHDDLIDRIWIFTKPGSDEVETVLFSSEGSVVYETTKADFKYKDIEWFLGFGEYVGEQSEYGTTYRPLGRNIYVPEQPIPMLGYRLPYRSFTAKQMQQHLFFDPNITRNILEKDGTEIYTDGKRGLQILNNDKWVVYTDAFSPIGGKNDLTENLRAAVTFVNQHGGWTGTYRFDRLPQTADGHTIVFRQYYGTEPNGVFPIVSNPSFLFGYKQLVLHQGEVARYEVSFIDIDFEAESPKKSERMLPGGKQLQEKIAEYPKRMIMQDLFPAYRPVLHDKYIELEPVWVAELTGGTYEYLD